MGCDITLHVERFRGGQWVRIHPPLGGWFSTRNYHLFYLLAGVRGESGWPSPFSPPRGLPESVSLSIRHERDRMQGFAASWYLLAELLPAGMWESGHAGAPDFARLLEQLEGLGPAAGTRLVFWFDS